MKWRWVQVAREVASRKFSLGFTQDVRRVIAGLVLVICWVFTVNKVKLSVKSSSLNQLNQLVWKCQNLNSRSSGRIRGADN